MINSGKIWNSWHLRAKAGCSVWCVCVCVCVVCVYVVCVWCVCVCVVCMVCVCVRVWYVCVRVWYAWFERMCVLCMHVCDLYVRVHMHICVYKSQRRMSGILFHHSHLYSLETGSLTAWSYAGSQQTLAVTYPLPTALDLLLCSQPHAPPHIDTGI